MEHNISSIQSANKRYKFTNKETENLLTEEDTRKKTIRYVINLGKNKFQYQSPKIRHKNKFIDTDINNDDEYINVYYKGDKFYLKEMQNKIEEQKNEIRNLKLIINKKEKEINELNYELYLTQNELEDNFDSEKYNKLLYDYDININIIK